MASLWPSGASLLGDSVSCPVVAAWRVVRIWRLLALERVLLHILISPRSGGFKMRARGT